MDRLLTKLGVVVAGAILFALTILPAQSPSTYAQDGSHVVPMAITDVPEPPPPTSGPGGQSGGSAGGRSGNPWIVKSVTPELASVGTTMNFVLTVTNDYGRSDDVVARDSFNQCLRVTGASTSWGTVTIMSDNSIIADLGTLFEDDVVTINIQAEVSCAISLQESQNTAWITSSSSSDIKEDNTATISFAIEQPATPVPTETPVPMSTPTPLPPPDLPRTGIAANGGGNLPLQIALLGIIPVVVYLAMLRSRD